MPPGRKSTGLAASRAQILYKLVAPLSHPLALPEEAEASGPRNLTTAAPTTAPDTPPQSGALSAPPPALRRAARWSAEAWLFARAEGGTERLPSPVLGGSQIGGRLTYRLNGNAARPLRASLRLYAPASTLEAAEVAAGIDWQPSPRIPLHLLAEKREGLSDKGRSAFALLVYGGASRTLAGGRAELYGQAGMVGLRERDLFADGILTLRWQLDPKDRVRAGVGAWGAIQPGANRIDAGPTLAIRPIKGAPVTLSFDWRQRIAGNAAPASGPALTLSAGF